MGDDQRSKSVKCCLCGELVLRSGWCDNCQRWPINVTPRRWCERAHPVDPDGLCSTCNAVALTRLDPANGEWRDTGKAPPLLSREGNHARLKELLGKLKDFGSWKRPHRGPKIPPEKATELAHEHAEIRRRMAESEVPF